MGADITLISTELLKEVQERTKRTNGTLKLQRCKINLQAYSHSGLQLKHVAPIYLTVGPMDLVHPVYVSTLNKSQCQVTDIAPKSLIDDAVEKPGSGSSTNSKDPSLCSLQEPESHTGPIKIMTAIDVQGTSVSDTALALWAENSAISLKLFRTLKQRHQSLPHVTKHSRFPFSPWSTTMAISKIICALDIRWNNRQ